MGDIYKKKVIEVFKFLWQNDRSTGKAYTKDKNTVDRALRSAWFDDLTTEIGTAYEITSRKTAFTLRAAAPRAALRSSAQRCSNRLHCNQR